uniref:EF-hand domain-containing protein n=1 Tax=Oryzias latipes TaxID=8090 RepID=A0A3B3I3M8_ORYLA
MARMEKAIKDIVDMFLEYANGDGKLSKDELKKMIEKEIQNPELKAKICAVDFDKAMKRMDKNRDGEIDFKEFLNTNFDLPPPDSVTHDCNPAKRKVYF